MDFYCPLIRVLGVIVVVEGLVSIVEEVRFVATNADLAPVPFLRILYPRVNVNVDLVLLYEITFHECSYDRVAVIGQVEAQAEKTTHIVEVDIRRYFGCREK